MHSEQGTARPSGTKPKMGGNRVILSYGISTIQYSEIIVFNNEAEFKKIISANPQMTAIVGADGYTKKHFPGVFVAGVKKSQSKDK